MKKINIILTVAVAAALTVGCKSQQEKEEAFTAKVEAFENDYRSQMQAIYADSTLTDEQKNDKAIALDESLTEEYVNFNKAAIEKNRSNNIAVLALRNIYSELENQELIDLAATLADSIQANPVVAKIVKAAEQGIKTEEGKMFVDFTIEDSDGKTVSFSDYVGQGKYVLVDFWASWCGPCKREIPNIRKAYETYSPLGLTVLSVAVWDKPEDTKDAAAEHGVVWNQIINAGTVPTELYGIQGIPQIMLFGPDGTILKRNLRGEGIFVELDKYFSK